MHLWIRLTIKFASLVFQLVDFARNLTTLLSSHYATTPDAPIQTSFPTAAESELSEAEWARDGESLMKTRWEDALLTLVRVRAMEKQPEKVA